MGAKFSKALRPRAKADASVAPASSHHDITTKANESETPRQDPAPRLPVVIAFSHDDITVAIHTTPRTISWRRNSAPYLPLTPGATRNMNEDNSLLASFEQFLAEQQLRNIDWELTPVPPLPVAPILPPPPPTVPLAQLPPVANGPEQCLICCTDLPEKTDSLYAKEVVKPCRRCDSAYCVSCVKKMFVDACTDMSRMPPRCCLPIHLHQAKPFLSEEETRLFRLKYEEWSTPKPFYCPVPVCSAFIPDRLLPQQAQAKEKSRVDSGIGTPSPEQFACPTCETGICMECRQPVHPGSICNINEFGLDAKTAALLKSWGYKKCPKCGHGVKRMFGCNHMECRCGAHFCWTCLSNIDQCGGSCYSDDEEDEDEDDESVSFDDEESPTDPTNDAPPTQPEEDAQAAENATIEAATQAPQESTTPTDTPPQAIPPRNLDGGGARHWANSAFDFGDEPSNGIQDRAWDCSHTFSEYKISFAIALTSQNTEMECERCWCTVHPQLEAPQSQGKIVPASASRSRTAGVRRVRDRYTPPRGLFRFDATIGTAPHLTTTISPLSQSVPGRQTTPMEDLQFSERIVDTYGNVIMTTPLQIKRRASLGSTPHETSAPIPSSSKTTNIFATPKPAFNLAHECHNCDIIVCESCMKTAQLAQEARKAEQNKRREAEQRERDEREQRARQAREERARLTREEQERRIRERREQFADEERERREERQRRRDEAHERGIHGVEDERSFVGDVFDA